MSEQRKEPREAFDWRALCAKAGAYPLDAFAFVQEGLRHTVEQLERNDPQMSEAQRHVTGRELCLGLRDFAVHQYGMLARTVLERWGVRKTDDFGKIVFAMVEAGLMRARETDSAEDFRGVFDFAEAFDGVGVG